MEDKSLQGPADLPERVDDPPTKVQKVSNLKEELDAINTMGRALEPLDIDARGRAMELIVSRYGLAPRRVIHSDGDYAHSARSVDSNSEVKSALEFDDIGALFEAAQPGTGSERALVAAYWFQVIKGEDGFTSQPLNDALKDLGLGLKNITDAFDTLKERTPSLIRQVQKSGPNKQGRKLYKVTEAGVRVVRQMIARTKEPE